MELLYLIVSLVIALTLHEFAHAWMSHWLGDTTAQRQGRLSLNPLVHIDPFMTLLLPIFLILAHSPVIFGAARPVPFNPWAVRWGKWGAALVAFAGPLTNLLLAIIFALWLHFVSVPSNFVAFFVLFISINVAFFVFNMIPLPPLDGSRIAYAVAPLSLREIMDRLERNGLILIFLILILLGPFIYPLLGAVVGAILRFLVPGLTGLST